MPRLERPAIFLVTSGAARGEDDESWRAALASVSAAAAAGIDVVQVREPQLSDRPLVTFVKRALNEVAGSTTRLVVNDRPDIALVCGAHGVHLRADGMSAARLRTLLPAGSLVGRSVHSLAEARAAAAEGAVDYVFFGTVFRSGTKSTAHAVQGTAALRTVCQSVSIPVIAIGGITAENAAAVAAAGASGLAAIGLFAENQGANAGRLGGLVRRLREAFA